MPLDDSLNPNESSASVIGSLGVSSLVGALPVGADLLPSKRPNAGGELAGSAANAKAADLIPPK